jgi:hypothetical protein
MTRRVSNIKFEAPFSVNVKYFETGEDDTRCFDYKELDMDIRKLPEGKVRDYLHKQMLDIAIFLKENLESVEKICEEPQSGKRFKLHGVPKEFDASYPDSELDYE